MLGAHSGPVHSLALIELQALVAALSLTGLFLGVMVDERRPDSGAWGNHNETILSNH